MSASDPNNPHICRGIARMDLKMNSPLDPSPILQTAFGFWHSKVLLTAVEFGLFTKLADRRLTGAELGAELQLHPRAHRRFLRRARRDEISRPRRRRPAGEVFQHARGRAVPRRNSPRYIGGILVMLNARLFKFWNDLPEALRTGKPQNEIKHGQKGMFEELYAELPKLEQFMGAMTGLSRINFEAFADKFDFSKYQDALRRRRRDRPALHRSRQATSASQVHLVRSAAGRTHREEAHRRRRTERPHRARRPAISSKTRCPRPTSSPWA